MAVGVSGLKSLAREMKRVGDIEARTAVRLALKGIALTEAEKVRAVTAASGREGARVAPAITGVATPSSAGIRINGTKVPGALGYEFGAGHDVPRTRRTGTYRGYNQFPQWTGSGENAGRFLWPTLRADQDRITSDVDSALGAVLDRYLSGTFK